MKRVLHVLISLERSGMEMMLLNSAEEWAREGYACDVVASATNIGPLAPELRAAGYGVFHIPFRSKFRYLPRWRFIRDYYRLCKSGYDVVHIHTEAATHLFVVLSKLAGVPRIALTPHNAFRFAGLLRIRKALERRSNRLMGSEYGMISDSVQKCEWERFRNRGIRISNWLDTIHYRPPTPEERSAARSSLRCQDEQFVIVSVGNCNAVKNHGEILRAISLLPATVAPLYLHVGNELADQPERALAAELNLAERVRFLGSQGDPRQFLWAADAYVMPSLREGLGMSALEAIASGVPAVLANIDGLADIAAETDSVVLTTTAAQSIAGGIAQVASTRIEERQARALLDSARIRERYSISNGVQSVINGLYRRDQSAA
jgi:glycosyltransferase involved in cell wall biosynthesis